MNLDQDTFELIEEYLEGTLSGAALSDFENKLESDPIFRALVDDQREMMSGIKKYAQADFKKKLDLIHQKNITSSEGLKVAHKKKEEESASKTTTNNLYRILSIAASILFLIGVGFYLFKQQNNSTPDQQIVDEKKDETEDKYASSAKKIIFKEALTIQMLKDGKATATDKTIQLIVFKHPTENLAYTFDGSTIALFTNQNTLDRNIEFFQEENSQTLKIGEAAYLIKETTALEKLKLAN